MARKAKTLNEDVEIVDETEVALEDLDLDSLSDDELDELEAALDAEEDDDDESEDDSDELAEDADGTGGVPEGASKSNMMSIAMKAMSNMGTDQIAGFLKSLEKYDPGIPDGTAEKNAASIAMKEAVEADLATVFGESENLSEEFKTKMSTLFESAVNVKVGLIEAELEEAAQEMVAEQVEAITEEIVNKVDAYLNYVAEQFVEENEIAIESSLRADIAESFMKDFYELLQEHNIEVPDEKLDAADMLSEKVDELTAQLNTVLSDNIELLGKIKQYEKDEAIANQLAGLTQVQADKFVKLAESIDFTGDVDEFSTKLGIIKESNFKTGDKKTNLILEDTFTQDDGSVETEIHDPVMKAYVSATKRTVKR